MRPSKEVLRKESREYGVFPDSRIRVNFLEDLGHPHLDIFMFYFGIVNLHLKGHPEHFRTNTLVFQEQKTETWVKM